MTEASGTTLRIGFYVESFTPGGMERFLFDTMNSFNSSAYVLTLFHSGDTHFVERFKQQVMRVPEKGVSLLTTKPLEEWLWAKRLPRWLWRLALLPMEAVRWTFFFLNMPRLRNVFRETPVDVLHIVNGGYPAALNCAAAAIAARQAGVRRILFSITGMPRQRLWPGLEFWFDRKVSAVVDVAVPCCQKGSDDLIEKRGFPAERVRTLYCGLAAPRQPSAEEIAAVKKTFALGSGPLIGNLSVFEPGKGQNDLIDAVELLVARFPDLRCLLMGSGKEQEPMVQKVRAMKLESAVIFTGYLADPLPAMAALDIFVHSTREDAFPYVVLQAMALEKPVVATRVGGIPEQVSDGKSGKITSPRNPQALAGAISELLGQPDQARRFGHEGFERYQQAFTLPRMKDTLEDIYRGGELCRP